MRINEYYNYVSIFVKVNINFEKSSCPFSATGEEICRLNYSTVPMLTERSKTEEMEQRKPDYAWWKKIPYRCAIVIILRWKFAWKNLIEKSIFNTCYTFLPFQDRDCDTDISASSRGGIHHMRIVRWTYYQLYVNLMHESSLVRESVCLTHAGIYYLIAYVDGNTGSNMKFTHALISRIISN